MSSVTRTFLFMSLLSAAACELATDEDLIDESSAELAGPRPLFQLPFVCGDQWRLDTWGHAPALDMVREPNQVGTEGALLIAPAAGTVNQSFRHSNAGNMIQINHGGGWFTTYLHLQSRAVSVGQQVSRGQTIGRVGRDGPTANDHPHLHYELAIDANGDGSASWGAANTERVRPWFNGVEYGQANGMTWRDVTSQNCGGGGGGHADFSGDGKADVLARNASNQDLYLYRGNGTGGFSGNANIANNWSAFDIIFTPGDFTGDGNADIIARHATNKDLYLYRGNGAGGFSGSPTTNNNWSAFDIIFSPGDFTGDGNADILARNASNKDLYLYRGNGTGGFAGNENISNNWSAYDIIFSPGDFTGDGKSDVIARHATNKDLYIYRGNGTGGFSGSPTTNNNWSAFDIIFSPGDFTGDGNADVLARHATNKDLYIYRGNGAGGFSGSPTSNNNWSAFDILF